jgi:hypothetical protein
MHYRVVIFKSTEVSAEYIFSNFRVEEQPKQNSMKQAATEVLLPCSTYFLKPEDGGDIFLRNFSSRSEGYTAVRPRRDNFLQ